MRQPDSFTTLDEWLPWLETLSPREIVLGLERVQAVLADLNLPRPDIVISVAGTNGKGSSAAMLEAMFANAGRKTGCYTSPHVQRYNERIRIGRQVAGDAVIISALERVQAARGELPLTFFEFGTLAALVVFADWGADTLILEVGMGGRLDAVNAVEPDGCLISSISLDHTAWLGNDCESIAAEKAGIMRASTPVVFGAPVCPEAITSHALAIGANLLRATVDFGYEMDDAEAGTWTWQGRQKRLVALCPPALNGQVQLQNAAAVLALIEAMGHDALLTTSLVNDSIGGLTLQGRFQVIPSRHTWVLDVAHNPAAAQALGDSLSILSRNKRVTAVIGMLSDKDVAGFVDPLLGIVDHWIAGTVEGARATPASVLAQRIANQSQKPCLIADTIPEAIELAVQRTAPGDVILVSGSFYVIGPALDWLKSSRQPED